MLGLLTKPIEKLLYTKKCSMVSLRGVVGHEIRRIGDVVVAGGKFQVSSLLKKVNLDLLQAPPSLPPGNTRCV